MQIAVCGPSEPTEQEYAHAYETGRLLAERGAIVLTGGYQGVMEAAARGAQEAGGLTVGILSGSDKAEGNLYLSVVIPTGLGEARNVVLVKSADAVIVIGGSWGTLSELAHARRAGRRVVSLSGWRIPDASGLCEATSPGEAVHLALG